MLDREQIYWDLVGDRDERSTEFDHVGPAIDETVDRVIVALRKKAGEYEVNKFTVVASAFKQFANELEQS